MPYCTRDILQANFGTIEISDLLDRDNDGGDDDDTLGNAIAYADAMVDGYLAARYVVPLADPTPKLIENIAADIVRYQLWGNNSPDELRKRYEDAIARLKDIMAGKLQLPGAAAPESGASGIEYVETSRIFTMDTLSDFG
jgi:phage gp36-like protein